MKPPNITLKTLLVKHLRFPNQTMFKHWPRHKTLPDNQIKQNLLHNDYERYQTYFSFNATKKMFDKQCL